jgi:hypothetical protein
MKRNDLGITDLLSWTQRTQRRQSLQDRVRQLVPGELEHDPLELFRLDVPVPVLVEISERLTQTFSLKTLDELGEFGICRASKGCHGSVHTCLSVAFGIRETYIPRRVRQVPSCRDTTLPNRNRNQKLDRRYRYHQLSRPYTSRNPTTRLTYALTPASDNPRERLLELVKRDLPIVIRIKVLERDEVVGIGSFQDYRFDTAHGRDGQHTDLSAISGLEDIPHLRVSNTLKSSHEILPCLPLSATLKTVAPNRSDNRNRVTNVNISVLGLPYQRHQSPRRTNPISVPLDLGEIVGWGDSVDEGLLVEVSETRHEKIKMGAKVSVDIGSW